MKNIHSTLVIMCLLLIATACKKEPKQSESQEKSEHSLSIDKSSVEVKWTAYKTTDKVAVSGVFNEVNISNESGTDADELVDGLAFSIPVSSIFSNSPDRDSKLQEFFFGVMENTIVLSGDLSLDNENSVNASITMNGVTKALPLAYSKEGNSVHLSGVMELAEWNALSAVESINKACFDLHKGADGVSKTWTDVKVDVSFSIAE